VDAEMRLNDAGRMVEKWWLELNRKFPNVDTDEYRVMPNHFHGIIPITGSVGADLRVGPDGTGEHIGSPLHRIVQWFKTMTTNEYIRAVKQSRWPPFCGRLWQRNFYEHIIRNEKSLQGIREYIVNNPLQWELDRENPNCRGAGEPRPYCPAENPDAHPQCDIK
jgi:REP element-mobilizing transposase RayT